MVAAVAVLAACGDPVSKGTSTALRTRPTTATHPSSTVPRTTASSTTTTQPTTTTQASTTTPPETVPSTTAPDPVVHVSGPVTAVGDSVMLDYQAALQRDVPGIAVFAAVSRQWSDGETLLQWLKASGHLGTEVVVGLGTNGPITAGDFDSMMSVLARVHRVVFVNVVVGQPWESEVNGVLAAGVSRYPNAVLADWASLERSNPSWVYSDGTHLPIDGPGARALAALVASKL
jgi:hypothetical protein